MVAIRDEKDAFTENGESVLWFFKENYFSVYPTVFRKRSTPALPSGVFL